MSQEIDKTKSQDLSLVARAIGTDLEHTQVCIIASANADMLFHYWKVGHFILYLQEREGWGTKVIDKLSEAIRTRYPNKKGYSARNLLYMCQFAKAYSLEVLMQLGETDGVLSTPSVEVVQSLIMQLNQLEQEPHPRLQSIENQSVEITQEPLAQFQSAANQSTATQLIEITQQPVAQFGEVEQTLFAIYRTDIPQIEEYFKRSAIVRTNWASHIIDNTPQNN